MTPEDLAEMEKHDAEAEKAFRKLERERGDLTAKNIRLRADIANLTAERDEARAEAARHLEHLRIAHPAHFTPNVLGQRMCGCGGAWPCQAERNQVLAEAAREEPTHSLPEDRDAAIVAHFRLYLQWRYQRERANTTEAAHQRALDVAAEHHDPTGAESQECLAGCPGCHMEQALGGEARSELAEARAAVERVRELHQPEHSTYGEVCKVCFDAREEQYEWPCPTILALDGSDT